MKEKQEHAEKGVWLSLITYIFLSIGKIVVGILSSSTALVADGLNNASDILVSTFILIGLKISKKPAGGNHPYGFHKAETIASLVASFIMMSIGIQVIIETSKSLFTSKIHSPDPLAAWVAIICAVVMFLVYSYNIRLAKRTNSQSLKAAAKDNLADSWLSIGVAVSVLGAQLSMPWLDPLAGFIIAFLICKTAWEIFRESSYHLSDGFYKNDLNEFRKTIKSVKGVQLIKDVKARTLGNKVYVDVIILVHPNLDVIEGHKIADNVEKILKQRHNVSYTHVHVEPVTYIKLI
ncbi:cation diffusion facilitator family transporter [Anaerobacillus sp. MEB173]|uniref:cation diffusion facilitator family transporter n=1 Tax=Anaerobacillus sp. MEB173 TaxID=3383345 RepID=UPI003F8EBF6F